MVTAKTTTETECDGGEEETGNRGPSKAHKVTANVGFLTIGTESIATLDNPGPVQSQYGEGIRSRLSHLRHEGRGKDLEEESN